MRPLFAALHRRRALVAWVIAFLVTSIATGVNGATEHGSALFLRMLAVAMALAAWPRRGARISLPHLLVPSLAVIVVGAGLLAAPHRGHAVQAFITVVVVGLLYLALTAAEHEWTRKLLIFGAVIGVAHAAVAVVQAILGHPRAAGGFFSPNDLAAYLAPLCVLITATINRARPAWIILAAVLGLGLLATASRSGLIAIAVGATVLALGRKPALAIFPLLLAVSISIFSSPLRSRWLGQGDPFSYSRTAIWRASAELGLQSLPWGVGLNFYEEAMRIHGIPLQGWVRYPRTAHHAHNEVLNAFVELGAPGLVAVLAPLVMIGMQAIRQRRRYQRTSLDADPWREPSAIVAVLASFAVPALTSASLHVPPVALLASVWAAHVSRVPGAGTMVAPVKIQARSHLAAATIGTLVILAALPGALAHGAFGMAMRARSRDDLDRAIAHVQLASRLAPWMLGYRLYEEQLRLQQGTPPLEVAERLVILAEQFPHSPKPLEATLFILRSHPIAPERSAAAWTAIATLSEQSARRDPRNALAWIRLAEAHANAGDESAALSAYERAVDEEPYCARALANLARAAARSGDLSHAHELARRAKDAAARASTESGRAREILSLDSSSSKILHEIREDEL